MEESELDALAYMSFPRQHRTQLHSTNPIERLDMEVKRRVDFVGIFHNETSIMRLIGAVLFEQNDEWQTASRLSAGRSLRQNRSRGNRSHSQHRSRLTMTSGHQIYTTLTDVTRWIGTRSLKGRCTGVRRRLGAFTRRIGLLMWI